MARLKDTIQVYRDHLARARNNIDLALDTIQHAPDMWHREILNDVKRVLDDMVSAIDRYVRKERTL